MHVKHLSDGMGSTGVLIWYNNKTKHFLLMYLAGSENIECVVHSAFSLTESNATFGV